MKDQDIQFNYIITIHNKEYLIEQVMLGVINSAGMNSHIYPVLDGCKDHSEDVIDEVIKHFPSVKITKLYATDVHELKTINIGLNCASQQGDGYNIILQDDVLLLDADLEKKCIRLYQQFEQLGMVSFRHGGNISRQLLYEEHSLNPLQDYIQTACGHFPDPEYHLPLGSFVFREAVIKSPICVPFKIIRELGPPDERYAPWDDIAYAYTVSSAGYANGVYAINFRSDVAWGTTRNKQQQFEVEHVQSKNLANFRKLHPSMPSLNQLKYHNKIYSM